MAKYLNEIGLTYLWGKIKDKLALHTSDTDVHTTADEKAVWNEGIRAWSEAQLTNALPKLTVVSLPSSGWNSTTKTQTITVSGVSANETAQLIHPVPALAHQSAYIDAGILCTGQAENSLTFTAKTIPTEDLTVYITIQAVTTV